MTYYLIHDVTPVGRFDSKAAAAAARDALGIERDALIVSSVEDLTGLKISDMRLMRAALRVPRPVSDMRAAATKLAENDPDLARRIKDKPVAARALLKALEAHDFVPVSTAVKNGKKPAAKKKEAKARPSAKRHLRTLFARKGSEHTLDEMMADGSDKFTRSAVMTAVSDLKNPKYCGPDGEITIERLKDREDNVYKRVG